jgi:hypothetical protein
LELYLAGRRIECFQVPMKSIWNTLGILVAVGFVAFLIFFVIVVISARVEDARAAEAARTMEPRYRHVVAEYSRDIKPGMMRKEVEALVRSHGGLPELSSWFSPPGVHAIPEEVHIGDDPHPWYCSAVPVFLVFEFEASHSDPMPGSDLLKRIKLDSRGDACL